MPKKRKPENKGLPARWSIRRKKYYYQVPPGREADWDSKKLFPLGTTLSAAYEEWAKRLGSLDKAHTVNQLLDRYALEVIPKKAAATQNGDLRHIKKIREVFGEMRLAAILPTHIYKYFDRRSKKTENKNGKTVGGATSARLEVAFFSHVYTKAVQWGYIHKHPFKNEVRLEGAKPRDRYVEDWEIVECLTLPSMRKKGSVKAIQAYIKIKLLTGLDQSDLLRIEMSDLKEDGLHNLRHKTKKKTGKQTIYEWTDELRAAVNEAMAARPVLSKFLFCNKRGQGYINEARGTSSGWDSMWQRFMDRVLEETEIKKRFTSHDLRAKAASDAQNLEHARALLAHADSKITNRIYRRKPEKVRPVR
ncbi:MAG: tyrosine-type recombinase/integrase [Bacteroidetes bacterium]|nr:tyrosine-type recombinase/integrase [Bacteroidota bacterium]